MSCCCRCSTARGCGRRAASATLYLWLDGPAATSEPFARRLLEHGILVTPGAFFGAAGEGYVRLALVPTLGRLRPGGSDPRGGSMTTRGDDRGPRPRRAAASAEADGDDWVVNEEAQEAILDYFRLAADGAARGRAVRVPRQDPAQVAATRRSACGSCRRRSRATARSSRAASILMPSLREHRRVGRAEHDGRHLGDGRLRRADRRRRPSRAAASGSAACSSRRARGR